MSNQEMDINKCKALLRERAWKVHKWDARNIVEHIASGRSVTQMREYASLGDDEMLPLFAAAKEFIESAESQKPRSPGRERDFPALSLSQTRQGRKKSGSSNVNHSPVAQNGQDGDLPSSQVPSQSQPLRPLRASSSSSQKPQDQTSGSSNEIQSSLPAGSIVHQQSSSIPGGGMAMNYQNAHPNGTGYPLNYLPAMGNMSVYDASHLNWNPPGTIAYQQPMSAPDGQIGHLRSSPPVTTGYQMLVPDDGMARNYPNARPNVSRHACRFHFSSGGCYHGARCRFSHAEGQVHSCGRVASSSGSNKIHLKFHPKSEIIEQQLYNHFSNYGNVRNVYIPPIEMPEFGFVGFNHPTLVHSTHGINWAQVDVDPYVEIFEQLDDPSRGLPDSIEDVHSVAAYLQEYKLT